MTEKRSTKKGFMAFICLLLTFSFFAGCSGSLFNTETTQSEVSSSSTEITEPVATVDYTQTEATETVTETTVDDSSSDTESETSINGSTSETETETMTEDTATVPSDSNPKLIEKIKKIGEKAKTPRLQGEAFFNDAVFVGDSVTLGLRNYVTSRRNNGYSCLGTAKFLCAGSMGWGNTLRPIGSKDSIHPKYQGKEVTVADGVKLIGAKKVFILLGINDIAAYSNSKILSNVCTLVGQIKDKNPGVDIYIESITPILATKEKGKLSNSCIDELNGEIKDLCKENKWTYVDVASCLKDPDNCLNPAYCSDPNDQGIHMTYSGCKQWIDYLVNHF